MSYFRCLLVVAFCIAAADARAQEPRPLRAGIYGGATIFPGVTGLAGLELDYRLSTRIRAGVRASVFDVLGPCSDADPVLDPDLCIADGRIYTGYVSFLSETKRRRTEPYIELGLGAYHYTDQIKPGELAPYLEGGVGLEVWRLRVGLRYGRILDHEVANMVGSSFAYFAPVLGLSVPF